MSKKVISVNQETLWKLSSLMADLEGTLKQLGVEDCTVSHIIERAYKLIKEAETGVTTVSVETGWDSIEA